MKEKRFGYEEFGLGILVGLAVGAALGVLLAPEAGVVTRSKIASRAAQAKESAQDLLDQAKISIEAAATKVEGVLGLQDKRIRRKLDELRFELEKYNLEQA